MNTHFTECGQRFFIEMLNAFLFVTAAGEGASLTVLSDASADPATFRGWRGRAPGETGVTAGDVPDELVPRKLLNGLRAL
ncbi:hypothetical protein [Actinomadura sp. B10D3]|uniref:hypothetical protein n=1 Tax=Actinomadura sp. B10D3 TaxID=3153557 RepID=UPI00325CD8C4